MAQCRAGLPDLRLLTPNTQLRLQYAGEWGKQEKSHGGSVVLEVKW